MLKMTEIICAFCRQYARIMYQLEGVTGETSMKSMVACYSTLLAWLVRNRDVTGMP